ARLVGGSGEVRLRYAAVGVWADGLVVRVTNYTDVDEARAAAERLAESRALAMSENLDLVRSIYAAWERGDLSESDWAHGEIEYVIPDGPAAGAWRGLSGMAEGVRTWLTAWQGFRAEAVEYRELDPECVLVLHRYGGQGKSSGLTLGQMHGEGAS